jgi:hypothetical protein
VSVSGQLFLAQGRNALTATRETAGTSFCGDRLQLQYTGYVSVFTIHKLTSLAFTKHYLLT